MSFNYLLIIMYYSLFLFSLFFCPVDTEHAWLTTAHSLCRAPYEKLVLCSQSQIGYPKPLNLNALLVTPVDLHLNPLRDHTQDICTKQ